MPDANHPWYGPRGKQPRRTISDELLADEIIRLQINTVDRAIVPQTDDDTVHSARDPSTASLYGGGVMRKPVRYE